MPYATTSDNVRLYYEEVGQGAPILFVHEFAGDHRSWEPQLREFGKRYRCIAYAFRGYTPSDVPASGDAYSYLHVMRDAVAVLDHLKIDAAHIVGLSMGGYSIAAHRQADDVRSVDLEMIEHGDGVAHHVQVAVGVARGRHVGRRITAKGISDAAVALAEFAQLRLPAAVIAGEFVHEQNRRALPYFFVIEPHVVGCGGVRHG